MHNSVSQSEGPPPWGLFGVTLVIAYALGWSVDELKQIIGALSVALMSWLAMRRRI